MENKNIPDAHITASSEYNNRTSPYYGRLNLEAEGGNGGAKSAKYDNYNQWLQVELGDKTQVTGIKGTVSRSCARASVICFFFKRQ